MHLGEGLTRFDTRELLTAGFQRLCGKVPFCDGHLALLAKPFLLSPRTKYLGWECLLLAHRDLASIIHVRNAPIVLQKPPSRLCEIEI